jgi:hypothetical protein
MGGLRARPLRERNSTADVDHGASREHRGPNMMHDGWMWGMGFGHLLGLIVLALVIAALVKYVFFR